MKSISTASSKRPQFPASLPTALARSLSFSIGFRTVKDPDEYSKDEAARRRDEVLKHMLNTPPKPRDHPPSRDRQERSRKKADEAQPGHGRGKSSPAS